MECNCQACIEKRKRDVEETVGTKKRLWLTNNDYANTQALLYHPRICPHCGKDTSVKIVNLQEDK